MTINKRKLSNAMLWSAAMLLAFVVITLSVNYIAVTFGPTGLVSGLVLVLFGFFSLLFYHIQD